MIPSNRLIAVAALLAPLGFIPALVPEFNLLGVLLVCLLCLTAGLDYWLSRERLAGFSLTVPELTRMTARRPGEISLQCHNTGELAGASLTMAPGVPPVLRCEQVELTFAAPDRNQPADLSWQVVPDRRGVFHISRIVLAGPSRLGLWEIRDSREVMLEIRVYPDLLRESGRIGTLLPQLMHEERKTRHQVGQGREFERLREFVTGDSLDRIHWKATAKRNKPMSKEYQVERTQEVYVLIDSSRLAGVPLATADQGTETVFELYVKAGLLTAMAAQWQGDLFGLCVFSSGVKTFLRAKGGKNHFNACREQIFTLESDTVSPDYRELVTFLGQRLRKRALLIVLTNLDDPILAEEFAACMDLLNRRHLVLAVSINPAAARPLFSDDKVRALDDVYRNLAGHLQDQRLRTLKKQLRKHGVRLCRPSSEQLIPHVIEQYMAVKERQQL